MAPTASDAVPLVERKNSVIVYPAPRYLIFPIIVMWGLSLTQSLHAAPALPPTLQPTVEAALAKRNLPTSASLNKDGDKLRLTFLNPTEEPMAENSLLMAAAIVWQEAKQLSIQSNEVQVIAPLVSGELHEATVPGTAISQFLNRELAADAYRATARFTQRAWRPLATDDVGMAQEYLEHGQQLDRSGQSEKALANFRKAHAFAPEAFGPNEALALWMLKHGKIAEAEPYLNAALRAQPDAASLQSARLRVTFAAGEWQKSLQLAEQLSQSPSALRQIEAERIRLLALVKLGKIKDADSGAETFVEKFPDAIAAWQTRAAVALASGKRDTAVKAAQIAAELDPANPAAWFGVAEIALAANQPAVALSSARRAYTLAQTSGQPVGSRLFRNLGQAALSQGDPTLATLAARTGLTAHPNDTDLQKLYKEAYLILKKKGLKETEDPAALLTEWPPGPPDATELLRKVASGETQPAEAAAKLLALSKRTTLYQGEVQPLPSAVRALAYYGLLAGASGRPELAKAAANRLRQEAEAPSPTTVAWARLLDATASLGLGRDEPIATLLPAGSLRSIRPDPLFQQTPALLAPLSPDAEVWAAALGESPEWITRTARQFLTANP